MGEDSNSDAPWGIVSVKPQDVEKELPMQPITSMRNSLGAEYGTLLLLYSSHQFLGGVVLWWLLLYINACLLLLLLLGSIYIATYYSNDHTYMVIIMNIY
jgi:hypothetical protein